MPSNQLQEAAQSTARGHLRLNNCPPSAPHSQHSASHSVYSSITAPSSVLRQGSLTSHALLSCSHQCWSVQLSSLESTGWQGFHWVILLLMQDFSPDELPHYIGQLASASTWARYSIGLERWCTREDKYAMWRPHNVLWRPNTPFLPMHLPFLSTPAIWWWPGL